MASHNQHLRIVSDSIPEDQKSLARAYEKIATADYVVGAMPPARAGRASHGAGSRLHHPADIAIATLRDNWRQIAGGFAFGFLAAVASLVIVAWVLS